MTQIWKFSTRAINDSIFFYIASLNANNNKAFNINKTSGKAYLEEEITSFDHGKLTYTISVFSTNKKRDSYSVNKDFWIGLSVTKIGESFKSVYNVLSHSKTTYNDSNYVVKPRELDTTFPIFNSTFVLIKNAKKMAEYLSDKYEKFVKLNIDEDTNLEYFRNINNTTHLSYTNAMETSKIVSSYMSQYVFTNNMTQFNESNMDYLMENLGVEESCALSFAMLYDGYKIDKDMTTLINDEVKLSMSDNCYTIKLLSVKSNDVKNEDNPTYIHDVLSSNTVNLNRDFIHEYLVSLGKAHMNNVFGERETEDVKLIFPMIFYPEWAFKRDLLVHEKYPVIFNHTGDNSNMAHNLTFDNFVKMLAYCNDLSDVEFLCKIMHAEYLLRMYSGSKALKNNYVYDENSENNRIPLANVNIHQVNILGYMGETNDNKFSWLLGKNPQQDMNLYASLNPHHEYLRSFLSNSINIGNKNLQKIFNNCSLQSFNYMKTLMESSARYSDEELCAILKYSGPGLANANEFYKFMSDLRSSIEEFLKDSLFKDVDDEINPKIEEKFNAHMYYVTAKLKDRKLSSYPYFAYVKRMANILPHNEYGINELLSLSASTLPPSMRNVHNNPKIGGTPQYQSIYGLAGTIEDQETYLWIMDEILSNGEELNFHQFYSYMIDEMFDNRIPLSWGKNMADEDFINLKNKKIHVI